MRMTGRDSDLLILFIVVVIPMILFWLVKICMNYNDFRNELTYLNLEISRTYGEERKEWKRERTRLLLSLLPFVKY